MIGTQRSLLGFLLAAALTTPVFPAATSYAATTARSTAAFPSLKGGALATFDVEGERFRVWVTNPQTIEQLKALRAGKSEAHIPNGRILRGPGKSAHNAPWRWHLDPRDIQMAEMTTEVCDGRPSYVNQHVTEFVRTVKRYCPWGARLVGLRVIPPIKSTRPAAPSNLQITSTSKGSTSAEQTVVTLQWRDNASNEAGFRIRATFNRMHGGTDGQTQVTGANTTTAQVSFVAGGINPIREACFTVAALNARGESNPSNRACVQL